MGDADGQIDDHSTGHSIQRAKTGVQCKGRPQARPTIQTWGLGAGFLNADPVERGCKPDEEARKDAEVCPGPTEQHRPSPGGGGLRVLAGETHQLPVLDTGKDRRRAFAGKDVTQSELWKGHHVGAP